MTHVTTEPDSLTWVRFFDSVMRVIQTHAILTVYFASKMDKVVVALAVYAMQKLNDQKGNGGKERLV